MEKKYQIIKNRNKEIGLVNSWFSYCKNKEIPFIVIYVKRKYADIEFDCFSLELK